jgi:hypothetical protein
MEFETSFERELCTHSCDMKDKCDRVRLGLGIWKPRGLRKAAEKGRCPLFKEDENEILMKYKDTCKWM